jgi:hypothetical protein
MLATFNTQENLPLLSDMDALLPWTPKTPDMYVCSATGL